MRRPVAIAVVALALVALGALAYNLGVIARGAPELHGTALADPEPVADVSLIAADGDQVQLGDYRGEHLLLFFGYTNCPDVCPLTMARLSSIYEELGEPEDLQVVMVTVDPERDTPQVTHDYASEFHPAFIGLGGTRELVDAAAERFYIGHRGDGHGKLIHSSQVLLVDPRGRFSRIYNEENQAYLGADLQVLLGRS